VWVTLLSAVGSSCEHAARIRQAEWRTSLLGVISSEKNMHIKTVNHYAFLLRKSAGIDYPDIEGKQPDGAFSSDSRPERRLPTQSSHLENPNICC